MTTKIAALLLRFFDHLGDDRWELGQLLADAAQGAFIVHPETKKMVQEFFNLIDSTGDLDNAKISDALRQVGTEFAIATANDFDYWIAD